MWLRNDIPVESGAGAILAEIRNALDDSRGH